MSAGGLASDCHETHLEGEASESVLSWTPFSASSEYICGACVVDDSPTNFGGCRTPGGLVRRYQQRQTTGSPQNVDEAHSGKMRSLKDL